MNVKSTPSLEIPALDAIMLTILAAQYLATQNYPLFSNVFLVVLVALYWAIKWLPARYMRRQLMWSYLIVWVIVVMVVVLTTAGAVVTRAATQPYLYAHD